MNILIMKIAEFLVETTLDLSLPLNYSYRSDHSIGVGKEEIGMFERKQRWIELGAVPT